MPKTPSASGARGREKKSQTFWLNPESVKKLEELSAASLFSKADLVNYWIEQEYTRQKEAGNLTPKKNPFPTKPKKDQ